MQDHEKHELFDRYLREELNEKELDSFLGKLKDPEFAAEFEMHRQVTDIVREHRRQELKTYLKENARVRTMAKSWTGKAWLVAAVMAALVVSYIVLIPGMDQEHLAQKEEAPAGKNRVAGGEEKKAPEQQEMDEAVPIMPKEREQAEPEPVPEEIEVDEKELMVEDNEPAFRGSSKYSGDWDLGPGEGSLSVKSDVRLLDSVFVLDVAFEAPAKLQIEMEEEGYYYYDTTARSRGPKKEAPQATKILVQLWRSPINYKGYRFDGRKLELFGMDSVQHLSLKYLVLDHDLEVYQVYIKYGDSYYAVVDDSQYHAYRKETDKTILDRLK